MDAILNLRIVIGHKKHKLMLIKLEENMSTKIYYFSGTGNSLFIAKKLHEKLPDSELIPILKALNAPAKSITAEKVIFVFPVYAMTLPIPVRRFLSMYDFSNASYFSAIVTRLGLYFDDFKRIDRLIKPQKLNSHFIINMGNNDVKVKDYECPSIDRIKELETIALKELDRIEQVIRANEDSRDTDSNYLLALPFADFRDKVVEWMVPKLMTFSTFIGGVNYFYTNSECNGCRICENVCLSGKISMNEGKPMWEKSTLCYMCYACINYCPRNAIEIESIPGVPSYTCENDRYCHPYANQSEIAQQKE